MNCLNARMHKIIAHKIIRNLGTLELQQEAEQIRKMTINTHDHFLVS